MQYALKLEHINLIYKSSESISYKQLLGIGKNTVNSYKALNDVSISIEKGKVYGIIGNNGAGKSTLLRVLSGVMSPNSGNIVRNHGTISLLALGIGFSKELTGIDNIYLNGMLLGFSKKAIKTVLADIIEYSELGEFINRAMKTYSSGMVSRLGFSIAINLRPEVLLIDEILSVGDMRFREKSYKSLRSLIKDKNTTAVIVSHSIGQVEDICDKVIWLEKGRIVTQGDKTEVIELYSQYVNNKIILEDIMQNIDSVRDDDKGGYYIDASHYIVRLHGSENKILGDSIVDSIRSYNNDKGILKITKRQLENHDIFLFFEYSGDTTEISVQLDVMLEISHFDNLYKKPPFDNRYGENKLTGIYAYCDMQLGSAVISNVYYYNELIMNYDNGSHSTVLELINENAANINVNQNNLCFTLGAKKGQSLFFILLSKYKLFRDKENLKKYMEHYYQAVYNNSVWNSFFCAPSGTYTKLPYSIEPFTKDGYGYSLHHSSRKDMIPFFNQTKERFFEDFLLNAVLQAYLYHNRIDGLYTTTYTSTWLKEDTGITAPYIDTRLNETFILMLQDFQAISPYFKELEPMRDYVNFFCKIYENGKQIYRIDDGVFFPDYFKDNIDLLPHASLNHQLGIAMMLLQAWEKYGDDKYYNVFTAMLIFISKTFEQWINEKGNLYYGFRQNNNNCLIFYGDDYIYVTLIDLLLLQNKCMDIESVGYNESLEKLIEYKIAYLQTNEYNLFSDSAATAPGEKIDSRIQALKLYQQIKERRCSW